MTLNELSDQFDVFLNSYGYEGAVQLNEYEKSVYLSKALWELFLRYYNGKNSSGEAFENTEEVSEYLKSFVKEYTVDLTLASLDTTYDKCYKVNISTIGDDFTFIVLEQAKITDDEVCKRNTQLVDVIPITHDDYLRIRRNPFKGPSRYKVLRVLESDNLNTYIKLFTKYTLSEYKVTYLEKPKPIILVPLTDENLEIDGENTVTTDFELKKSELMHRNILELAVRLALADRQLKTTKDTE